MKNGAYLVAEYLARIASTWPPSACLAGPTAGYLMAYPFAAYAMGWINEARRDRENSYSLARLLGALLAGEVVNRIVVPSEVAHWARLALERMLTIT